MRHYCWTTILDPVKTRAIAFFGLLAPVGLVLVSCESPMHVVVDVDPDANLVGGCVGHVSFAARGTQSPTFARAIAST